MGFENKQSKENNIILRGIKNVHKPKNKIIHPITFKVLKILREKIFQQKWSKLSKQIIWSCCCLAFFGSFRISEIVTKHRKKFDKTSELRWKDVKFHKKYIKVCIKKGKTSPSKHVVVYLFKINSTLFCPYKNLKCLKKLQVEKKIFNKNLPLFRFASGIFLTTKKLNKLLKNLLCDTNFGKSHLTSRCFRYGIPSEIENIPELLNNNHVKNWGRWRSSAYKNYMKNDLPTKEWIFRKVCATFM